MRTEINEARCHGAQSLPVGHRLTNENKVRDTHNGLIHVHDCRMVMGHRGTAGGLKGNHQAELPRVEVVQPQPRAVGSSYATAPGLCWPRDPICSSLTTAGSPGRPGSPCREITGQKAT